LNRFRHMRVAQSTRINRGGHFGTGQGLPLCFLHQLNCRRAFASQHSPHLCIINNQLCTTLSHDYCPLISSTKPALSNLSITGVRSTSTTSPAASSVVAIRPWMVTIFGFLSWVCSLVTSPWPVASNATVPPVASVASVVLFSLITNSLKSYS